MNRLVDFHAHMDDERIISNIDSYITDCVKKGVKIIISNGTNVKSNRAVLELSKKYNIIKSALGIYPLEVLKLSDKELKDELDFIKKTKCIAIGEVGLDFFTGEKSFRKDPYTVDEIKKQEKYFRKFIKLAVKKNIPLIIHSRKAEKRTIEILEDELKDSPNFKKVIMHCFSGKFKLAQKIISNGWYLTIPANVKRNPQFQKYIKEFNLKQLLTETDSPYLSPNKGELNLPYNVKETIDYIANIKQLNKTEVSDAIFLTYMKLFM